MTATVPIHADDVALAKSLSSGDEQAFNQFYELYFDRLFRFVSRRLDDKDSVQDVLQNSLINALKHIEGYRGEASLFTWLCQISRSELSVYFKKNHRLEDRSAAALSDSKLREILETLEAPVNDLPDIQTERQELVRLILLTLDYLPGHYGDVLEWKYVKGLSVKRMAEELGQSPEAVQSMLQRARKAFRDVFDTAATDAISGDI